MPHVCSRRDPVTIRAAGGPTVIVDIGGLRLVTDPTFDPPGTYLSGSGSMLTKTAPPALTPGQIGSVDALTLLEPGLGLTLRQPSRGFLGPCHASFR